MHTGHVYGVCLFTVIVPSLSQLVSSLVPVGVFICTLSLNDAYFMLFLCCVWMLCDNADPNPYCVFCQATLLLYCCFHLFKIEL
jgi:hypothetical protein